MQKIRKVFRLVVLVCAILLAGIGIGISGGVPLTLRTIRKDKEKENIELIENGCKNTTFNEVQLKS